MKLKEYITKHVTFYEEIEKFFNLQMDQEGNITRDISTGEEGSQLTTKYSCDICDTEFEYKAMIKLHWEDFHREG